MMIDLGRGCRDKKEKIAMKELKAASIGLNSDTLLIKLPDPRVLRIVSRSFFMAVAILTLPSIGSIIKGSSNALYDSGAGSDSFESTLLPTIFQDLADEGLLKKGHKGLILNSVIDDLVDDLQFLKNEIDFVIGSDDLGRQNSIPNETFDFLFALGFQSTKFIDGVLKIGGIVVMELSNKAENEFQPQSNYKIVYLRRFDSTVVALRKIGLMDGSLNSPTKRRLCGVTLEAKKAALRHLEGVLLEPPRRALAKSSSHMNKFKFLPDLLGNSLESYQRRIFITDEKNGVVDWFYNKYPTKNQHFEVYSLEVEMYDMERAYEGSLSRGVAPAIRISNWLRKNVREEDYVVMKAEAQVVEEMMKDKTVCLVDELFLECKSQWQNSSKRAYWQCLALYGRLRDEGVAVHQWWG